ncbi:HD domain-containing protein [Methanosphaera cuniculi]|uniref:Deoxyguanosinetriphosphate triphosphohydrolase-like protein n=1 Tax=Methanosphaera cuniculi TaxID=1077256 RepID=A0A2V2BUS3_9EURY|nr:HD domain-containing protein [Methanosphaera cuniculi]PWL07717.1 deoxyguanosinetriphosphate triphosphohydrolase-like protein [Methanosphaera cuniculi]
MGYIRDSIHGDLHLNDFELEILDTVEMQRLRRIKQLGFTNLIYPGANHTRFEHSIGTLFLADKLAKRLGFDSEIQQLLRICGLLHDIGHAPFSHVTERALKHKHETVTKQIIKNSSITDKLSQKFDPKLVMNIVDGKTSYGKIISGDLDVDRMDYLKRDSYYTGVAYGVIDTERLIYSLTYDNNELLLSSKGVQAAESTLLARYFMYPTVYQHHTTRIVNGMFRVAIKSMLNDNVIKEDELRYLDDGELINITRNTKGIAQQTIQNIDTRHLYKKTDTIPLTEITNPEKVVNIDEKYLREAEVEIAEKLDINPECVILDVPEELSFKKMNTKVQTHNGLKPLNEVSPIIESLKKAQYKYADIALFMSKQNKQKAEERNIKIEDYLTLPT